MLMNTKRASVLATLLLATLATSTALAQVSATGTVTAAPSGPNFLYTISLHNTGTSNIDTFWFSWLPDNYDFMPSVPSSIVAPTNWTDFVETGSYGSSIEFFDTASSPITPGQTNSSFQFLSSSPPSSFQGNNPSFGLPVTYSYVYANEPAGAGEDPLGASNVIFNMSVTTVPEPTSIVLAGIGGLACLLVFRRLRMQQIVGC